MKKLFLIITIIGLTSLTFAQDNYNQEASRERRQQRLHENDEGPKFREQKREMKRERRHERRQKRSGEGSEAKEQRRSRRGR